MNFFITRLVRLLSVKSGANGVVQSLQNQRQIFSRTNAGAERPLKLCIDPNIALYRDRHDNGIWSRLIQFLIHITGMEVIFGFSTRHEVFFYENIPNRNSKQLDNWNTGYFLSKELVEETMKCLNKRMILGDQCKGDAENEKQQLV